MIEIYKKLQPESPDLQFIKAVGVLDGIGYYYYHFPNTSNIAIDILIERKKLLATRLEELSKLRDDRFSHSTVEYKGMATRIRDKDIGVISSMALTGGVYEFENGSLDMDRIEFLELAEVVNLKRTEIIKDKIAKESTIKSMTLEELYYLNVRIL